MVMSGIVINYIAKNSTIPENQAHFKLINK
jgi:hypothetical protein